MIIQAVRRVSLCVFLACLAVGTAHARFPGTGVVNGVISGVGSGPPPVVTIGRVTVNVTDQTVIQVGGGQGTVDDLVAGAHARATFDVSTHNALQIVVRDHPPARLDGRIDAVDAGATPPTVTIAGTTLKVMPGTRIRVAGVPGTLDDLIV